MQPKRLYALGAAVLAAGLVQWVWRSSGGDDEGRVAVSGAVRVSGAPLESGRIIFRPDAKSSGPRAVGLISDGRYNVPRNNGPTAGDYRVTVEVGPPSSKEAGLNGLREGAAPAAPPTLSPRNSVQINAGQSSATFDFDL